MEAKRNSEIFGLICNLITAEDFQTGQVNFFEKNCQVFTDDEENKHEYKNIHESYIALIDDILEAAIL